MNAHQASNLRLRVAVFVLLTLTVLIAAAALLGRSHNLFSSKVTLHTSFANTGGLIVGSSVRLAGVDVGIVRSIHFDRDPKVRRVDVDLSVGSRYLDRIRTDSVASVVSKGLLGDMIVDVTVGSDDSPSLKNGDHIESAEVMGIGKVIEGADRVIRTLEDLVIDVDNAVHNTVTPQVSADFGRITHATAAVLEGVAQGPGLAHALIYEPGLSDDTLRAVRDLQRSVADIEQVLNEARSGKGLLHEVIYDPKGGQVVADLAKVASGLDDTVGAIKNGPGLAHSIIYDQEAKNLLRDLAEAARIVHKLAEETDEGKGTIGGLLKDPTAYQDLTTILGNLKRNETLKTLVRWTISKDDLDTKGRIEPPASPDAGTP
jgi:phospholipid/cholesterol/gamma-HCH transport system substrate-binding protein